MARSKSPKSVNEWFPDPLPAMVRARKRAENEARQTKTRLVEAKGDKPVWVRPKARSQVKRGRS
jgi:hypothetical protein